MVYESAGDRAYLRGTGLIAADDGINLTYYLFNGHGDVVQLADENGTVTQEYAYDAFGVEQDPDAADTNPLRYCGEYNTTMRRQAHTTCAHGIMRPRSAGSPVKIRHRTG